MKTPPTYASGFIDALALVSVTILLLLAALFAGGCTARRVEPPAPPTPSTGCIWTVIDVQIVELDDDERLEVQP